MLPKNKYFMNHPLEYAILNDFYNRNSDLVYQDDTTTLVYNKQYDLVFHIGKPINHPLLQTCRLIQTNCKELNDSLLQTNTCTSTFPVYTAIYTKEQIDIPKLHDVTTRPLTPNDLPYLLAHYDNPGNDEKHLLERIEEGMLGLVKDNSLIGFIGIHEEGTMGFLFIDETQRHKGYAYFLEATLIQSLLNEKKLAYCQIATTNKASIALHQKFEFTFLNDTYYWLGKGW